MKAIKQVPSTSVCRQLHVRRERLVRILEDQIRVAKKLSDDTSKSYSVQAKYAWDIVEELSQKLEDMTVRLEDCLCEEKNYYERMNKDDQLSVREYDF